ncbi:MAG TPA: YjjG family noncanonical pyrimidine nucleotidase [Pseudothermotoga sp.]|nr:YjjG family noncanonical pyrimidine nucleotidase [Pseudothermotoga sp.]HOK84048.1 YjjG family noncanonical pyrimidine nucleotidase [Pseudothermotoga sp.]HPP70515.1 YjjG family noncanonical pyrimidine nucleotidase [Pseudothermotoga sp.]
MKYEMVYFDLDNTLLDFSRSEKESLCCVLAKYGYDLTDEQVQLYVQINKKWWQAFSVGSYSKEYIVVARFEEFLEKIKANDLLPDVIAQEYLEKLSNTAYFMEGAEQFLEKMKIMGQRMAVLTNGVEKVQKGRAKLLDLDRFVEFILTSEKVGKPKPDPAIFVMASQISGVSLANSIYVGDDLAVDYEAAKNAGVDFILFDPSGTYRDGDFTTVTTFNELYTALCV